MDADMLGHRLREARLAKKLTQAEVVGTFITRNMLSQIESGTATPSLEYLAQALDLPLSSLIADEPDESAPSKHLFCAKKALKNGAFDEVIALCGEPSETDPLADEYYALLARAYYGRANNSASPRAEDAEKAADLAAKGVYASRSLQADALLLERRLTEKTG